MTEHLQEAYRVDIETRTNADGNQREFPEGHNVNVHEISAGIIYKDGNVTVSAFSTKHAMESYGYRFDTPDRTIVVSGETNPTQATIDACSGCDVLILTKHKRRHGSRRGHPPSSGLRRNTIRRPRSWLTLRDKRSHDC